MDYEKTYKEALERAKIWQNHLYDTNDKDYADELNFIFPELKESEDERMRRDIIRYLKKTSPAIGENIEKMIAWLEKQGEQKPILDFKAKDWYASKVDGKIHNIYHSVDKVKPKFKVGDWVILTAGELSATLQIVDVDTNKRLYWFNDSSYLPIVDEECLHPWTINDAKDGDVLVDKNGCINIYKEPCDKTFYYSHGYCYYPNHGYMYEKDGKFVAVQTAIKIEDANPATKQQRDQLEKAMADAGYMFDFEKKELKKVEQKHAAWSEEDEKLLDNTIRFIENCVAATSPSLRTYNPILTGKEIPFLKSLKDRVQPQPKQEWSEEDESIALGIEQIVNCASLLNIAPDRLNKVRDWLKSLRPQNRWKPTELQMDVLLDEVNAWTKGCPKQKVLESLYNDLKKLMEE